MSTEPVLELLDATSSKAILSRLFDAPITLDELNGCCHARWETTRGEAERRAIIRKAWEVSS